MTESQITGCNKKAGATVYLMEELGDARLRCDQLLRYLTKAVKLIEQSEHKDHFFEVAGDLIRAVPETAFKLHKALQAVALAADRLDYEEIKQDLKPEKVDELERVLKDVRIRPVQRRSEPMDPAVAIKTLRQLAAQARKSSSLPLGDFLSFITDLENVESLGKRSTTASADDVAERLELIAHALANPPENVEGPSRLRLATMLREILGKNLSSIPSDADISSRVALRFAGRASEEDKQSRFEEGKPADPTKNMSPEDAKSWKDNTEEHKDQFKKDAATRPDPKKLFSDIKDTVKALLDTRVKVRKLADMLKGLEEDASGSGVYFSGDTSRVEDVRKRLQKLDGELGVFDSLEALERPLKSMVKKASDEDKDACGDKLTRFEEGKPADPTKDMSPEDAKKWKENTEKHKDQFKVADSSEEDKQSRFEEGKPADPTKNMSPEDAKAWKDNTEEHKDKFKAADWKVSAGINSWYKSQFSDSFGGVTTYFYPFEVLKNGSYRCLTMEVGPSGRTRGRPKLTSLSSNDLRHFAVVPESEVPSKVTSPVLLAAHDYQKKKLKEEAEAAEKLEKVKDITPSAQITKDELRVLAIMVGLKPAAREREFSRGGLGEYGPYNVHIAALIKRGLINVRGKALVLDKNKVIDTFRKNRDLVKQTKFDSYGLPITLQNALREASVADWKV